MGKHNIENFSLGYQLLKTTSKLLHDNLYRKTYVFNLPKKFNAPHLFALNHQNALMDAMAILFASGRPLVFLARSDIFKKSTIAKILYFLKILPIFRIRDGFEALKNNDEIFQNTIRILNYPRGLAILPEGNHFGQKRIRQLQKGFARIAFQTMESNDKNKTFLIIPTGIDYEDYEKFGTQLIVNFGEPFEITEYFNIYQQNQAQGLIELRDRLSHEIEKLVININSERWYDTILFITKLNIELGREQGKSAQTIFKENQKLANRLSQESEHSELLLNIEQNCKSLKAHMEQINLNINTLYSKSRLPKLLLLFIIRLPFLFLSIPGFLFYGWYYILIKKIVTLKIKDPQFRTSVRFGAYTLGFLLLIFIESLISLLFPFDYSYPITIIGTILSGLIALKTFPKIIQILKSIKSSLWDLIGNKKVKSAIKYKSILFEQIIQTTQKYDTTNKE